MPSDIKIPKVRVAVLIGKKGVTKRLLQKKLSVKLIISPEGDVEVIGEPFEMMVAIKVVRAIGRGFNPKIALLLMNDTFHFDLFDMKDFARSEADVHRVKGRLIGTQGKAWKTIEKLTEVDLAVYGHTVALIGEIEKIEIAKLAVEKLMRGAPHGKVYSFIDKMKGRLGGL